MKLRMSCFGCYRCVLIHCLSGCQFLCCSIYGFANTSAVVFSRCLAVVFSRLIWLSILIFLRNIVNIQNLTMKFTCTGLLDLGDLATKVLYSTYYAMIEIM